MYCTEKMIKWFLSITEPKYKQENYSLPLRTYNWIKSIFFLFFLQVLPFCTLKCISAVCRIYFVSKMKQAGEMVWQESHEVQEVSTSGEERHQTPAHTEGHPAGKQIGKDTWWILGTWVINESLSQIKLRVALGKALQAG